MGARARRILFYSNDFRSFMSPEPLEVCQHETDEQMLPEGGRILSSRASPTIRLVSGGSILRPDDPGISQLHQTVCAASATPDSRVNQLHNKYRVGGLDDFMPGRSGPRS